MSPGEKLKKKKAVKTLPMRIFTTVGNGSVSTPTLDCWRKQQPAPRSDGTARQKAEHQAGQSEARAPRCAGGRLGSPSHARPRRARGFRHLPRGAPALSAPRRTPRTPAAPAATQAFRAGRARPPRSRGELEGRRGSTFALEGAVGVLAVLLGAAGRRLRRTLVHIWNRTRSCERQARPPPGQSWPPNTARGQGWPGGHALMAVLGDLLLGWGRGPWCHRAGPLGGAPASSHKPCVWAGPGLHPPQWT